MTDLYLQSLGFVSTQRAYTASRPAFSHEWRYQHEYLTADGTFLYLDHLFGTDSCRLTSQNGQGVFATLSLHDRPALEAAIRAFHTAHGGQGLRIPPPCGPTL